jgi:hypothetical protein
VVMNSPTHSMELSATMVPWDTSIGQLSATMVPRDTVPSDSSVKHDTSSWSMLEGTETDIYSGV